MNGSQRKALRTAMVEIIEPVFSLGPVKSGRTLDARDKDGFVLVYFAEGAKDTQSLVGATQMQLAVEINLSDADYADDDLDDYADEITSAINSSNHQVFASLQGFQYEGFEYGLPEERPFIALHITYSVYA